MLNKKIMDRFLSKVNKTKTCWLWTAFKNRGGYGQFCVAYALGRPFLAHRVSYEYYKKKIPEGLCVLHRCDVAACVNPDHLFLGTKGDNNRDMKAKGRTHKTNRGETNTAKLSEANVAYIRRRVYYKGLITELAEKYSVNTRTIWAIRANRTWNRPLYVRINERVPEQPISE